MVENLLATYITGKACIGHVQRQKADQRQLVKEELRNVNRYITKEYRIISPKAVLEIGWYFNFGRKLDVQCHSSVFLMKKVTIFIKTRVQ